MPRAFLMCVGTRDPFWADVQGKAIKFSDLMPEHNPYKVEGPILTFFRFFLPPPSQDDKIFLFSTQSGRDPTEKGGEATKEELRTRFKGVDVEHWRFPSNVDPSEFADAYSGLTQLVEDALKSLADQCELIVYVSPGTPQMQAAWYALSHAGKIKATLYRIFFEGNKPVIKKVDLGPLLTEATLQRALEAFRQGAFFEAASLFQELGQHLLGPAQRLASFCAQLSLVYQAFFAASYARARGLLRNVEKNFQDVIRHANFFKNYLGKVRADLTLAEQLQGHLVVLFHTAYLRLRQGQEAEALWRAASVVEAVELKLAREAGYGGMPSRLAAHKFLQECGLPHALADTERENTLFRARNDSLHRGKPVTPETAEQALEWAKEAILRTFPDCRLDDHVLSGHALGEVARHLEQLFR